MKPIKTAVPASKLRRRKLVAGLVLILVVGASLLGLRQYSGLAEATWYQILDCGVHESRNNSRLFLYLARFLARLSFNPQSGYYDFEAALERSGTNAERCFIA